MRECADMQMCKCGECANVQMGEWGECANGGNVQMCE
jgi:hypothetical protein